MRTWPITLTPNTNTLTLTPAPNPNPPPSPLPGKNIADYVDPDIEKRLEELEAEEEERAQLAELEQARYLVSTPRPIRRRAALTATPTTAIPTTQPHATCTCLLWPYTSSRGRWRWTTRARVRCASSPRASERRRASSRPLHGPSAPTTTRGEQSPKTSHPNARPKPEPILHAQPQAQPPRPASPSLDLHTNLTG